MKNLLLLTSFLLAGLTQAQNLHFVSSTPTANANAVARNANISLVFDANVNGVTANAGNIVITGSQTGLIAGSFSGGGTTAIVFDPANDFKPGEVVSVTLTTGLASTAGALLSSAEQFGFRTASVFLPPPLGNNPQTIATSLDGVRSIYAADIDGDGDLDALSASNVDDTIAWHENDGNQNFTAHNISTSADGAQSVYAADIDGDGDMDALSASLLDHKIAWYENDGNQNFTTHTITTTANGARSVYATDMDGDGDMDVLSASSGDDTISWYENNGSQNYTIHAISISADDARSVHAADMDGDGDMDALSASFLDDKIVWYENNGAQSFTAHTISIYADGGVSVYSADMDGDGDMDALSASTGDDKIAWYENDGAQNFITHPMTFSAVDAYSVYPADIDGDGDMDALSTSTGDDKIIWYQNDGAQNFIAQNITTSAAGAASVHVADMDGDGDMDVLGASVYDDEIILYSFFQATLQPNSSFPAPDARMVPRNTNIILEFSDNVDASTINSNNIVITGSQTGLLSGNFSGGGTSTIVFDPVNNFKAGETIQVTLTEGVAYTNGTFLFPAKQFEFHAASGFLAPPISYHEKYIHTSVNGPFSVHATDMDGDGDMDALSASSVDGKIFWHENDGVQNFTAHTIATSIDLATSVYAIDMDSDGDMDVLSASALDDTIAWHENNGSQSFTTHIVSTSVDWPMDVFATDMDSDGDMDALSASRYDDKIAWYENDGTQNFTAHSISVSADGAETVYPVDMDGDGDLDVLSASLFDDKIAWHENDGAQNFSQHIINPQPGGIFGPRDVQVADMDGDGDLDVLSASADDKITWFRNGGTQNFNAFTISTDVQNPYSVHAADIDGDGDMDVLSTSHDDNTVVWHENVGPQYYNPYINFNTHILTSAADQARDIYVADMDGDGDIDALSASFHDDTIAWYEFATVMQLTAFSPSANANTVARDANITLDFDTKVKGTTVNANNIVITGSQTGLIAGTFSGGGTSTIVFDPINDFKPGEKIQVVPTARVESISGGLLLPQQFEFRTVSDFVDAPIQYDPENITLNASGAQSVYATDMDGDGDMDVLSASHTDDKIAWYENDGTENFTAYAITTSADGACSVHAADMDGDGDMDVLSASRNDDTIAWYENDGAQNFTAHAINTFADNAQSVYAADMDADGDMDVLSASSYDNEITWYENFGQTFVKHIVTYFANGPQSVYAVDMEGDGDMDVLSASRNDDKIAWYENDGTQNFTPYTITTSADYARSVHATDMDGDGDIDVLSASNDDNKIAWYENDGAQNFTTHVITASADDAESVYAADMDGDGDMDVLSASFSDNKIAWYENDGGQNFASHTITTAATHATSVYAADMDGDGDLDALSASVFNAKIAWYSFSPPIHLISSTPAANTSTVAGDSDIVIDFNCPVDPGMVNANNIVITGSQTGLVTGSFSGGGTSTIVFDPANDFKPGEVISITLTSGLASTTGIPLLPSEQFEFRAASGFVTLPIAYEPKPITTSAAGAGSVNAVDMDGDGDMDALSASANDDTIAWYENDGTQNFTAHNISTSADGTQSVYVADMDGDGDMDALSASLYDNKIAWYENDGSQNFTAHNISTSADGAQSVYAADMDGDGDMDALSASFFDNTIAWYENDGAQNFTAHNISTSAGGAKSVYAADMDGDGDMDALSASLNDNKIAWYENDGTQNFTAHNISTSANDARSVYVMDIDGDGDMDALSASFYDDTIAWYENDGFQNFTAHNISTSADAAQSVYAADMDGDGDMDALSASLNDNKIAWHEFIEVGCPPGTAIAYVDENASGNATGESWADAYTTLPEALLDAAYCPNITEIRVAQGTYYPTSLNDRDIPFEIPGGVEIKGGYDAATGNRNLALYETVLSGEIQQDADISNNSYHVVFIDNPAAPLTLDGFTITAGNANGLAINSIGGGVLLLEGGNNVRLKNLIVHGNQAISGAVTLYGENTPIASNTPVMVNCLVYGNSISDSGALYAYRGMTATLVNCTIANNANTTANGASGIRVHQDAIVNLKNSIVFGNTGGGSSFKYTGTATQEINLFYTLTDAQVGVDDFNDIGNNIFSTNIPFKTIIGNDYSLVYGGQGVDAGNNVYFDPGQVPDISGISTDLAGNARIQNGGVDMGSYESMFFRLVASTPPANSNIAARDANIELVFDTNVNGVTANANNIVITGSQTGLVAGSFSGGGTPSIVFDPANDFKPGETIQVTLTVGMESIAGVSLSLIEQFEFRAASDFIAPPFVYNSQIITISADNARFVYAADMDGDGDMDALSTSYHDDKISWHENNGFQNFTDHLITYTANGPVSVYPTDMDGDGDMDALGASNFDDEIAWYENDGGPYFTPHTIDNCISNFTSVYAIDIDGDGDIDALSTSTFNNGKIAWYENDGALNFIEHDITTSAGDVYSVYATDMDADGDIDVLSASYNVDKIAWYENDGFQNFTAHNITTLANGALSVYAADMDGDGDMDALSASNVDDKIAWYENDGLQNFSAHTITASANGAYDIYAADMDGDGDMDALSASNIDDKIAWYENDGFQNFSTHNITTSADGTRSVYAADMDGDGDLDALSASADDDTIAWYEFSSDYGYIYENNAWTPGDPSGVSTSTDNVLVVNGTTSLTADTQLNLLTIDPGATLNIEQSLTVDGGIDNNGNLVFLNNATMLGQLDEMSGPRIFGDGEETVQRHIPARNDGKGAYRYLSSAVNSTENIHENWQEGATSISDNPNPGYGMFITGSTTGSNGFDQTAAGAPSMFVFDETSQTYVPVPNTDVDKLVAGQDYVAYVWGDRSVDIISSNDPMATTTTLQATGKLVVGDQSFAGSPVAGEFNLFGNPYQAIVDMNDVLANSTNLNPNIYYIWDPNLGTRGAYATVSLPVGSPTPSTSGANQFLQPGQAAWTVTSAAGAASILYEESDKDVVQTPTDVFKPKSTASIELQLFQTDRFANGQSLSDALRVNFSAGENNAILPNDAPKLWNFDENIALVNGNNYLAVENRGLPTNGGILQLYNGQYRASDYVFKTILSGFANNVAVYLNDAYLNIQTPLNHNGTTPINFNIDEAIPASIAPDRFSLSFDVNGLSTGDIVPEEGFEIYPNPVENDGFFILVPGSSGEKLEITIYTLLGQRLYHANKKVDGNGRISIKAHQLQAGTYMVKINQGKKVFLKKLIVK